MLQRPQRVPSLEANAEFSGVGDGIEDHQPSSIRDLRPNTTVEAHLEEAAGEVARIANRANARAMRGQRVVKVDAPEKTPFVELYAPAEGASVPDASVQVASGTTSSSCSIRPP